MGDGEPGQRGGGGRVGGLGSPLGQPRPPPAGVTVGKEDRQDKVGGPVYPGPGASGVVVQGEAGLEVRPPGEGGRGG